MGRRIDLVHESMRAHTTFIVAQGDGYLIESQGRKVFIRVGDRYKVEPENPKKKQKRGRIGVIQELCGEPFVDTAVMKFEDTKRVGTVDMADLVPCDD